MVIHILKDGTRAEDITGHIIRFEDSASLYHLIHKINHSVTVREKERTKEVAS